MDAFPVAVSSKIHILMFQVSNELFWLDFLLRASFEGNENLQNALKGAYNNENKHIKTQAPRVVFSIIFDNSFRAKPCYYDYDTVSTAV